MISTRGNNSRKIEMTLSPVVRVSTTGILMARKVQSTKKDRSWLTQDLRNGIPCYYSLYFGWRRRIKLVWPGVKPTASSSTKVDISPLEVARDLWEQKHPKLTFGRWKRSITILPRTPVVSKLRVEQGAFAEKDEKRKNEELASAP